MRKLMLLTLLALAVSPAYASHTPGADGCPIHLSEGSADNPNLTDPANDWEGAVFGNGTATVPAGDVYREGTDIVAAWLTRSGGAMTANIQVATLSELQPNSQFYLLWTNGVTTANGVEVPGRRWVNARLKGYETVFTFGNLVPSSTLPTSNSLFRTEGSTTGRLLPGTNTIQIDVPATGTSLFGEDVAHWGAPAAGSVLDEPLAEARLLAGSPEPLPPNPTGLRHGFVYVADTTANGEKLCPAIVD